MIAISISFFRFSYMDLLSDNLSFWVMMFFTFIPFLLFLALLVAAIRWLWSHSNQ